MSHDRSFSFMAAEELALKAANDRYRVETLRAGVLAPLKRFGFGGLDEAFYALLFRLVPGWTQAMLRYLNGQIVRNAAEVDRRRGDAALRPQIQHLLDVRPNPATLHTFRHFRAALRRERLTRMAAQGEPLYATERVRYACARLGAAWIALWDVLAAPFGAVGRGIVARSRALIMTIVAGAVLLYAAPRVKEARRVYDEIAIRYEASAPEGAVARPLKRTVPEHSQRADANLEYTRATECDSDDDDCVEEPERLADPQAASATVVVMRELVLAQLADDRLAALPSVSAIDRARLVAVRESATDQYVAVIRALDGRTNQRISYPTAQGHLSAGTAALTPAVEVLERYLPAALVEEENARYAVYDRLRRIEAFALYVFITGFLNLFRKRQRKKHYGEQAA